MQVSFYKKNIEYAVSVPVKIYQISAKIQGRTESKLDVIGETILKLLKVNSKLDVEKLSNLMGIPREYKKLIKEEISELRDDKYIILDENNRIECINEGEKYETEMFYILYDVLNNRIMDCLIEKKQFEKNYLMYTDIVGRGKITELVDQRGKKYIDEYKLCYEIEDLIDRSNKAISETLENENIEFIKPNYKIKLDEIIEMKNPKEAKFLYKTNMNSKLELEIVSPFNDGCDSEYIEKYIKHRIDVERELLKIQKGEGAFYQLKSEIDICKERASEYLSKYKRYDKEKYRMDKVLNIATFRELMEDDTNLERGFSFNIQDVDSIVKGLLKEITRNLGESKIDKNSVIIDNLIEIKNKNDILILEILGKKKHSRIVKGKKILTCIGEKSIVSYLSSIYISYIFTGIEYDKKISKAFDENKRINLFLNELWLYRNNTIHNVENIRNDISYDLDSLTRERLKEVIEYLMEELLYFIKFIKNI